jgi:phosphoenolpyruvate phosphomutase
VTVVTGYKDDAVVVPGISKVVNADWEGTGELASLVCARDALKGPCLISYGDILFRDFLITLTDASEDDFTLVVDSKWTSRDDQDVKKAKDLVACSLPFGAHYLDESQITLRAIGAGLDQPNGRWTGILRTSARGTARLVEMMDAMSADGTLKQSCMADLLQRLIDAGETPAVVYVTGHCIDVNDVIDLTKAQDAL